MRLRACTDGISSKLSCADLFGIILEWEPSAINSWTPHAQTKTTRSSLICAQNVEFLEGRFKSLKGTHVLLDVLWHGFYLSSPKYDLTSTILREKKSVE